MPQGLQIFDASGKKQLDTSYGIMRVAGTFDTGLTNTVISIPEIKKFHTFWCEPISLEGANNPLKDPNQSTIWFVAYPVITPNFNDGTITINFFPGMDSEKTQIMWVVKERFLYGFF